MSGDRFQPTADSGGGGGSGITQLTQDVLAGPSSGSVAATVVGLRTRGISATAPTNGQVLEYDSGTGLWTPTTPTSGTATLYPPLDSHDLGLWLFDAASGNFANQGSAGVLPLVVTNVGSPGLLYGQASPLGKASYTSTSGNYEAYCASAATTLCQPTSAVTLTALFKVRTYANTWYSFWGSLELGGASAFGAYIYDVGGGTRLHATYKTVDQGQQTIDVSTNFNVPLQQWIQVDFVYDGANANIYSNGGLVASAVATGGLVYGGAAQILAGALSSASTIQFDGWNALLRIRNVATSADDVRLSYRSALAWA